MSVQDIVLGGFGPTGSVSLIVTAGFGGTTVAQISRDLGAGGRRKKRPELPLEFRAPEIKQAPAIAVIDVPVEQAEETQERLVPRSPVIAQAMHRALAVSDWKPAKKYSEKLIKAINAPLPVFHDLPAEKPKVFSLEDDDEEIIFLMYH